MKLYLVDRGGFYRTGQTIDISRLDLKEAHPYLEFPGFYEKADLIQHIIELFPEGLSYFGWQYIKERHTFGTNPNLQHNTTILVEMNLEYVRRAFFPTLPSRLQSVFACETLKEAEFFRMQYGQNNDSIFEIEADRYYKADMRIIFLGVQNITGSYLAHNYWKGIGSANPFWEYIVQLPITIGEQIV